MMCFKKLLLLPALIAGVCFFSSCDKEKIEPKVEKPKEDNNKVTLSVQVSLQENVPGVDYTDFIVEFKELRTLKSVKKLLTDKGLCEVSLDKGTYTINVEWEKGNVE